VSVGPITPPIVGTNLLVGLTSATRDTLAAPGAPTQGALGPEAVPLPPQTLTGLIAQAAATQDGLAGLFADLAAAAQIPTLPAQLRADIQQILTSQPALNPTLTAQDLKAAVTNSGLFLEAQLGAAAAQTAETAAPAVANDFKAQLLQLVTDLVAELQPDATAAAANRAATTGGVKRAAPKPPPPVRGAATSGQQAVRPAIDETTDEDSLVHILEHDARAALARLELSQIASMQRRDEASQWRFELPVATPDGRAFAQFEISKDGGGHAHGGAGGSLEPTWRTRFSLDVAPSGPVHAEVAVTPSAALVTLWVEDPVAREALARDQTQLMAALAAEGLGEASVRILPGAPHPPAVPAGSLVDQST